MRLLTKSAGRPLGPIAESILELLGRENALTARQIAMKLKLSVPIANKTCSRLLLNERIKIVERKAIANCNKPVSIYSLASPGESTVATELLNAASIFKAGEQV